MTRTAKSTTTWAVCIALVLLVFYLLSVPALLSWVEYSDVRRTGDPKHWRQPPPWLIAYATPYNILYLYTPLKQPLLVYHGWCNRVVNGDYVLHSW